MMDMEGFDGFSQFCIFERGVMEGMYSCAMALNMEKYLDGEIEIITFVNITRLP